MARGPPKIFQISLKHVVVMPLALGREPPFSVTNPCWNPCTSLSSYSMVMTVVCVIDGSLGFRFEDLLGPQSR